jgi:MFS transporter, putative metabolite:H+ symporter
MTATSEPVNTAERSAAAAALLARMEGVPFSRLHMKARVVMGSATFFDAFDALSLAFALPVLIGLWHISPAQAGVLISASYVGQLVGALLFSGLAERFGRVLSATAAVAIMSVMSLGSAFAWSFSSLLAFRLVQGVGIGGEMPVAAAYIGELSRARGRGRFFLLYEMIFPIGLMATGQVAAWAVPAWGWKSMFLIGAVPGLVIVFLLARLPESPRWLISKGRLAEAEAVVRQLERGVPEARRPEEAKAPPPMKQTEASGEPQRSRWAELLSEAYRTRTLIVWLLWASAYFVSNGLNNWMPSLYNTVYKLGLRQSLRAASLTNVAQVAVLLVCAFSIDRIGRRNWTVASFIVGGMLLAALGVFGANSAANVILWGTLSYGIIGSANAVLYLYTPEIYPTRMRAMGVGLATAWLRIASAVGPVVVGFMVSSRGVTSVFLMLAGVAGVGGLVATRMIETRGRRLEEIAA